MSFNMQEVNQMPRAKFVAAFGSVVEHSPWVAENLWDNYRPFHSRQAMHQAIMNIIMGEGNNAWLKVLLAHPELSGKEAEAGTLTDFSTSEQNGLGLNRLSREDFFRIRDFNSRYRDKFGFPFVVCARNLKDLNDLYATQVTRFNHTVEAELKAGMEQVYEIAYLRLETLIRDQQMEVLST